MPRLITRAENRTGSLFEKHFKRIKVDSEKYLKQLIIYVNLNPEIHFGKAFKTYTFSPFRESISDDPKIVKSDEISELFGGRENFQKAHENRSISLSEELTLE